MAINSLDEALKRIADLEEEVSKLKTEIEVLRNRNLGGRKKHDKNWMASYNEFIYKYESGMTLMEIVAEGEISRRTAYRYLEYYKELCKINGGGEECDQRDNSKTIGYGRELYN